MIQVAHYTAQYDEALCRTLVLRQGSYVRIEEDADGREYDSFKRRIREAKLALHYVREMPRAKAHIWEVRKAPEGLEGEMFG